MSHYPHPAARMNSIEYLEEQLQILQIPIDQAMRLNRQAMAKIREGSKTVEFRRCQSCPLLVVTMIEIIRAGDKVGVMGRVPDRPLAAVQTLRFPSLGVLNSIQMNKKCSELRWCGMICDGVSKPSSIVVKRFSNNRYRPRVCVVDADLTVEYLHREGHRIMYTPSGTRR
ncbi:hypothetical protein N7517_006362 [Penicillium concentricum]|uniref:Uncharacterized protein n=1 Tax=Penicillium concentricum TaxID=293559 RepID=A0A9W9S958_9EURO|nr:uncharacterized protein N7517_006362 [Penicillium concentricum]KAJ5374356.1 hypothetical protein N7517_006362 [Penicillium concentricum]